MKPRTESGTTKGVKSSSSPPSKSRLMASPQGEVLLNVETSLCDPEHWKIRAAAMLIQATGKAGHCQGRRRHAGPCGLCDWGRLVGIRARAGELKCFRNLWHPPVCYVADPHRPDKKSHVHSRLKQVQHPGVGTHEVKLPRGDRGPESGEKEEKIPLDSTQSGGLITCPVP